MRGIPPVKSVMTAFPYSVEVRESIERARELMTSRGIRHLPVVDDGRLVSVISDRDIEHAAGGAKGTGKHLCVGDLSLREAFIVGLAEPLDRVLVQMAERHTAAAVVVREGKLVGIFTTTDACRHFARLLRSLFPPGPGEDVA